MQSFQFEELKRNLKRKMKFGTMKNLEWMKMVFFSEKTNWSKSFIFKEAYHGLHME